MTIREEEENHVDHNTNDEDHIKHHVAPVYMEKSFHESDTEKNRKDKDFSSDDEEIKQIKSSSEDEELRKDSFNQNASYISSKKFKNELKTIRVRIIFKY